MSAAYTDAIYESYRNAPAPFEDYTVVGGKLNTAVTTDLSGRPLPAVSRSAVSLGAEYAHRLPGFGGAFTGYVDIGESYRSGYFSNASLTIYSWVPAVNLVNAQLGVRTDDGHWDLRVWSRNLLNRNYFTAQAPLSFNTGAIDALLGDPRTFGVTLDARF